MTDIGLRPGELEALTPPADLTVSEWAEAHRILTRKTAAEPGPWRNSRVPYAREVMDCFSDPYVEEVTLQTSAQVGKTEMLLNAAGRAISQDPGPLMFVLPTEDDCKYFVPTRVEDMILASPDLSRFITGKPRDQKTLQITLAHMAIYAAWSNSPAKLSSRPVKYLFLDEIDKMPAFAGRSEADPLSLARERTATFWDRKIGKASTPTTRAGLIHQHFELGDRSRYHVPCPHCDAYQVLSFRQIEWPKDVDADEIVAGRLAAYRCAHCGDLVPESAKPTMLARGAWVPDGSELSAHGRLLRAPRVRHRSFHLWAGYSPWRSWSEVAAQFLVSRADPARLQNFVNSWLGEIWEERLDAMSEERLEAKALPHPAGTIPDGVLVLTAAVDVQKSGFWWIVVGWGYDERAWIIESGFVDSWEAVARTLRKSYERPDGSRIQILRAAVDSGDGNRAAEVYQFCRQMGGGVLPIKGERSDARGRPIWATKIKTAGVVLWHVNTGWCKTKALRMMHAGEDDHGCLHLHRDPPPDLLRQLCSEQKVVQRNRTNGTMAEVFIKRQGYDANHLLDALGYAIGMAWLCSVHDLRRPTEEALALEARERRQRDHAQADHRQRQTKGWLQRMRRDKAAARRPGRWAGGDEDGDEW